MPGASAGLGQPLREAGTRSATERFLCSSGRPWTRLGSEGECPAPRWGRSRGAGGTAGGQGRRGVAAGGHSLCTGQPFFAVARPQLHKVTRVNIPEGLCVVADASPGNDPALE